MFSLARVTQNTPRWSRSPKWPKSTYPLSNKAISPLLSPAHTSRARRLSCSAAVSTTTKPGNKLCRFSRALGADGDGDQGELVRGLHVDDLDGQTGRRVDLQSAADDAERERHFEHAREIVA